MDTLFRRCAGLDVHKKTVMACVRVVNAKGRLTHQEVQSFGTMTEDLLRLRDWLQGFGVTHVAMESTGVLWKPVFNVLEDAFEQVMLVNPQHIKNVPGRKTDVKDCQWIAQLLQHGLLKGSYVPSRAQRDLRDLTRLRVQLINERTRVTNRIHKVLEDANIKLGAVASDILGVSGRAMLEALVAGQEDPQKLAELAKGRLRGKLPQLRAALQGRFTDHHRYLLKTLLEHWQAQEDRIGQLDARIQEQVAPFLSEEDMERLDAIPGVNRTTIEAVVAEIGADMTPFPSYRHLSRWSGLAPGNYQSAGKRSSGKRTKGNVWVQRVLADAAWAASRTKRSYYKALYRRIAARRGKGRALLAVSHSLLVVMYHLLKYKTVAYQDLGPEYFDKLKPADLERYLVKRLERLGYTVTLQRAA